MSHEPMVNGRFQHDAEVVDKFLNTPSEESFTALFDVFSPQLFSYFRARRCAPAAPAIANRGRCRIHTQRDDRRSALAGAITVLTNVSAYDASIAAARQCHGRGDADFWGGSSRLGFGECRVVIPAYVMLVVALNPCPCRQ
jgi:hypothetical protein